MTKTNMDLITELLQKQDEGDFLRTIAEAVLQLIMEDDVEGLIGAEAASAELNWRSSFPFLTMPNPEAPPVRSAVAFMKE